jgi:hypothetical protein
MLKMAIFRFKCSIEDYDDLYRLVEVKSACTFQSFRDIILQSFGFDNHLPSSFFMSDDIWRMEDEITSGKTNQKGKESAVLMQDSKLSKFINDPHQKIILVYDYDKQWTFHLELVNISPAPKEGVIYPYIYKTVGIPPKQYNTQGVPAAKGVEEDEFDFIKNQVLVANEEGVSEEEGFNEVTDDEEKPEGDEDREEEIIADNDDI